MALQQRSPDGAAIAEKLIIQNDLSQLKPTERLSYYRYRATILGVDWRQAPFDYLQLKGKLTLYVNATGCELLRRKMNISIVSVVWRMVDGVVEARVEATTPDGRRDVDVGLISTRGASPSDIPDLIKKAVTQAKNRVTRSLAAFGTEDDMTDEQAEVMPITTAQVENATEHDRAVAAPTRPAVPLTDRLSVEAQEAFFAAAVEREIGGITPVDTEQTPGTQTWGQIIEALSQYATDRGLDDPLIRVTEGKAEVGHVWRAVMALPLVQGRQP